MSARYPCQACGSNDLHEFGGFSELPRVTSDSKIFRPGGRLFACRSCGMVQKIVDQEWLRDIGEIYRDYDMYHQSSANDQAVFDPITGKPSGRCEVITRRLQASGLLPASGRLLDVGAGSGAMLAAFSAQCKGWRLFGLDLDDRKEEALRNIVRFEKLFTIPPEQLTEQFDLITLIHSLEHFTAPLHLLKTLRDRLAPGGRLFVEVNNVDKATFDLVVADHLSHLTPRSLTYLLARAGYRVDTSAIDWVNKEMSMLASPDRGMHVDVLEGPKGTIDRISNDVNWLRGMISQAREAARHGPFAIFGTSVAATWLAGGLGDVVTCFVDEDPAREGRTHLGRPILRPSEVPEGTSVYLAFVPEVCASIARRLAYLPIRFVAPKS